MEQKLLQQQYDVCVPCREACPIRTDIPGYIEAIRDGDMDKAQAINRRDNVFPGVLGRVCHRPCEPACRHGLNNLGTAVQICFLKRAASDLCEIKTLPQCEKPNGKQVCIIGSGPSGMTTANDLALAGCKVTVLEQFDQAGGMLQYGIPEFRLPRDVVNEDIQSILDLGVELKTNVKIHTQKELQELQTQYDAVVIAGGCMRAKLLEAENANFDKAVQGLEYMERTNKGQQGASPEHVVVIGGGFTAVDCARSALRQGAAEVTLVYRRTIKHMRVGPNEIQALESEGIRSVFQYTPQEIVLENDRVSSIKFSYNSMEETSRTHKNPSPFIQLNADLIIFAIGQEADDKADFSALSEKNSKLYLTGDFRDGSGTVIEACAAGRQSAKQILKDLELTAPPEEKLTLKPVSIGDWKRKLEDNYIPEVPMPTTKMPIGLKQEVESGFTNKDAHTEAKRCYLCHYQFEINADQCIYCMKCIDAMPVDCIRLTSGDIEFENGKIKANYSTNYNKATGIVIDYDNCVRCGKCVEVCPVNCIKIQKFSVKPT